MSQLRWYYAIACLFALGLTGHTLGQTPPPSIAAPSAATAAGAEQSSAMPEDLLPELKPILRRALDRSPEQIRLGLVLEQAEAHTYISRGAMLPNLGVNGRYAVNSAATASGTSNATSNSSGFFYDVGVSQPVYYWGSLKAQLDIDRIYAKIAGREYADAARLLTAQVRRSYLDLIAKKMMLRAEQRRLELTAKDLARQEEKFKASEITAGDITSARTNYQEAQLGFDRLTAELAFLKRVFMRLTGLTEFSDDAIPAELPKPTPAADKGEGLLRSFLSGGVTQTYRAQIFALRVQKSGLDYSIAKTGLYPKFSFNAGHNVSNSTQADINQVHQEAIVQNYYGVIVNWTLFDGLATRGRKLEALGNKRENERQLQSYVDATTDLAQNFRQQAEFAARALNFAEIRLTGAHNGLKEVQEALGRGRASQDEVERAEASVLTAEALTALARGEYLNRWTEFVSLVGADPAMNNLSPRYVR